MQEKPAFLSATTILSDQVVNPAGQDLGTLEDLMIDLENGRIAYAVISFDHGFLGFGGKRFAMPWPMLELDHAAKRFVINVSREVLEEAPGIGDESWPDHVPSHTWLARIYDHYGYDHYW
jgi:sporulation protein YlmC with PRC-barrel domain